MICPKCGKSIESDQRFCRSCGEKLVAGRPNVVRMAAMGALTLVFAGLMVSIFGKMFEMRWLAYIGLVVMMTGAFAIAAYSLFRETRPRKSTVVPTFQPIATLEKVDTTNKLLPLGDTEYIPSVVENTTELLKSPAKR
jgi:predicted nucleic acid-binding Zn ribbon protein